MRDVVLMFTYVNFKDPNGLLDFGFSILCDGSFRSFLDTGSFKVSKLFSFKEPKARAILLPLTKAKGRG